ncbi:hypothetical protein PC129_g20250 [Phytophthora cactorum]|uniref:Tc1-like transposase DDE domain-containing protein n=1 Tax=Phytophthora cactorum TaxID=29920 RepID=A0A329RPE1_9STRA|nr:hypothetical protein Pcac1_g12868 [Phytophthora cactorum]KAG2798916.1 hypothetical protein PC112_g21152 [Phytophthora cactorum]KAG2804168.1 hypothetical protein PC111_g18382 [Phytophthora cactorum]KAG2830774.1 hypothetical protein PC113_g21052 [Phytophthora cactorum]KAG2873216.1 hypothetical protein PC114_g25975 [Phytophthora cactorum]
MVVIVLNNAPVHLQTDERVTKHADMELLRLGPYSPMCNPIEACFSVPKVRTKTELAIYREEVCDRARGPDHNGEVLSIAERQIRFLESAAKSNMKWITPVLVSRMELHRSHTVNAAADGADMEYGV